MTKEDLDADRINYLIWRYLQESNYQETAVKLQSEWNLEDPQQLTFAPHVRHRALVALLQEGLFYNELKRNCIQARGDGAAASDGFFGPVAAHSPPAVDEDDQTNGRKRSVDERPVQAHIDSLAKRPKLSNGHEHVFEPVPMDVDEHPNGINGHASYPSPKEVEEPPPLIITNGPEQGTQVEKVTELSAETTFLSLTDNPTANNPILLHCEWNPRDATVLAAAGTNALARVWTVARGSAQDSQGHVNGLSPPSRNLMEDTFTAKTSVTALAWTSDGAAIAVASDDEEGESARISIWGADSTPLLTFAGFDPPVVCVRWNPTNTLLLALMLEGVGTAIKITSPASQQSVGYSFSKDMQVHDATWISEFEFLVCGGDSLVGFRCTDGVIVVSRKFETREESGFTCIAYDPRSQYVATGSENGVIDVWDAHGERRDVATHEGSIISLAWQPISTSHMSTGDEPERLLAVSGDDGTISIWNARGDLSRPKSSMAMGSSVVALAFTPDGAFLATATSSHILIWRLEDTTVPRARWVRGSEPGWKSTMQNGVSHEEDHHCLCWDADGQKLAYGVNSQLAVIRWRPFVDGSP